MAATLKAEPIPVTTRTPVTQETSLYSRDAVRLVAVCFILSGSTGLIYEVLWARMLGLVFGGTTLAVSTVLAAFMGGLALGSALAGRGAARLARPLRCYGLVEIGIAIYALLVPTVFRLVDHGYAFIWQNLHPGFFAFSLWRFGLSSATLLVPTTLMGATLPVLAAVLLRGPAVKTFGKGSSVTWLYTCNLLGAIGGTVSAGFFLLPALGLHKTIYVAAAINLVIGIVALLIDARARQTPSDRSKLETPAACSIQDKFRVKAGLQTEAAAISKQPEPLRAIDSVSEETAAADRELREQQSDEPEARTSFWLFVAFVSGFVTIGTQVAWTRVLTMVIGSSTYAFSMVVALFLIGLSVGAWEVSRKDRSRVLRVTIFKIEIVTAVSLFFSISIINFTPWFLIRAGQHLALASWGGLLALQCVCAGLLILLPAFLMGTVMPMVLAWAGKTRSELSVRLVGRSYAVNTMGAIAGAFLTGFISTLR